MLSLLQRRVGWVHLSEVISGFEVDCPGHCEAAPRFLIVSDTVLRCVCCFFHLVPTNIFSDIIICNSVQVLASKTLLSECNSVSGLLLEEGWSGRFQSHSAVGDVIFSVCKERF